MSTCSSIKITLQNFSKIHPNVCIPLIFMSNIHREVWCTWLKSNEESIHPSSIVCSHSVTCRVIEVAGANPSYFSTALLHPVHCMARGRTFISIVYIPVSLFSHFLFLKKQTFWNFRSLEYLLLNRVFVFIRR